MIRNIFYFIAKILGDFSAIKKRRIRKRVGRRITGKIASRFLNKLFR